MPKRVEKKPVFFRFLLLVTFACNPAQAAERILEQGREGYSGTEDAAIFEENPTFSSGGGETLFSGRTDDRPEVPGGKMRRSAIRFDLSSIPVGVTILAVTLELVVKNNPPLASPTSQTLHPITKDWNEGSKVAESQGEPSNPGDITWNANRIGTENWSQPGGDFGPASATATVGLGGSRSRWSSTEMLNDIEGWRSDPASHFGWMLVGDEATLQSARGYYSSEGTAGRRPRLVLITDERSSSQDNWQLLP